MWKRGSFIPECTPPGARQQCGQSAGVDVQPLPALQSAGAGHDAAVVQVITPVHSTSHLHAVPHVMAPPHACLPPQLTSHAPEPQVVGPTQLIWPPHETEQSVAPPQSTPPAHALRPAHVTTHGRPAGQVTAVAHELGVSQWMTHVSPAHELHSAGQGLASGPGGASIALSGALVETHQPETQVRPDGHVP
jgi:hypothetical protein